MKQLFLLILSFLFLSGCYVRIDPGTGKKIGKIVKLSKQGLIFKTWEGELIRGGFSDGSGTLGGSFHFTIENDELADEALKYLENQAEVILQYRAELISSITRSQESSPNFVIKIVKNEKHQ